MMKRKSKKFLILILGVIISLSCVFSTGCQVECTRHSYVLTDGKLICAYCGAEYEEAAHNYVNGVCKDCGKIDYAEFTNFITKNVMSANFTVCANYKKSSTSSSSVTSQGSGVIYKKESSISKYTYYILTNNHVVVKEQGYNIVNYYVKDYLGNQIDDVTVLAADPNYDLAVVKVKVESKDDKNYKVLSLASANAGVNTEVVSLGQPLGQGNAITYGKIKGYCTVSTSDPEYKSNVKFPVVNHTAYINNGSSGGLLMDRNFNIIGINYAGMISENNFYAVPVEKVIEFLTVNGLL